jgi:hypothetical protein
MSELMIITLLPHQEKALDAAIKAGVINSVEEFVDTALAQLPNNPARSATPGERTGQALIDVCAEVRDLLTDEDVDRIFARNRLPSRSVDLS